MQHPMIQEHAMWIASVLGPFLLIQALWILFYQDNMTKVFASIKSTPAVFHLIGLLNFLFGLVLVSTYNIWEMNILFFVTLLGWVFIIRGILICFMPQVMIKSMAYKSMRIWGIIQLIWSLLLCWAAFGRG